MRIIYRLKDDGVTSIGEFCDVCYDEEDMTVTLTFVRHPMMDLLVKNVSWLEYKKTIESLASTGFCDLSNKDAELEAEQEEE